MKLIIESKAREGGMREIKATASILNGEIVSDADDLAFTLKGLTLELQTMQGGQVPIPTEVLKYAAAVLPRARLLEDNGSPVTNKVKQTIRHGKDEKGFYSEIISEEQ